MPEGGAPPTAAPRLLFGFDFGGKRIGIACGDTLTRSARPLAILDNGTAPPWRDIETLLAEWRPTQLVIGLPYNVDGSENAMTQRVRVFAGELEHRSGLPCVMVDERYSSIDASARLAAARRSGQMRRGKARELDAAAACVILERWFANN